MLNLERSLVASASDIVNYLGCAHRTTLDLIDLETSLEKAPDDEEIRLVQEKGRAHEAGFLEGLRAAGGLSKHGVRELELDDLLRGERFVDLYRVVREALRISEPGYSPLARTVLWRRQRCSRSIDRPGGQSRARHRAGEGRLFELRS